MGYLNSDYAIENSLDTIYRSIKSLAYVGSVMHLEEKESKQTKFTLHQKLNFTNEMT